MELTKKIFGKGNDKEKTNFYNIYCEDCIFIMVDIQEKFKDIIYKMQNVVKNADILNKVSEILEIPLIVTEQSPDKLGKSIENIYLPASHKYFQKTKFSAMTDEVKEYTDELDRKVLIVYGIEAHVCITQTCLEASQIGYDVVLISDAVSSRKAYSKEIALNLLEKSKINVVTTEMLLFNLLNDAKHPKFRDISKLVK
ncbi:MAG: isochorismatase family protein [Candidatus Cloacimonetes bacterium]|nr:isochorismatase family protein [Candidatus Cloacimonadota bacterium]